MPSRRPPSPDLFAYAESEPVGWKQRAALSARLPRPQQLADLSEAELAELTCLLSNELQRRIRRDTRGRLDTHLARAMEQARVSATLSVSKELTTAPGDVRHP